MGAQLSLSAQTSPSIAIFSYVDVLDEVHYLSQLNSSGFLKTCRALDPNGKIIIKVFIKPSEEYDLKEIKRLIDAEASSLATLPTALNYSKVVESSRAGYLIRQHLKSNLYDRLSYRPYLSEIEMKFMVFQLLQALKDVHDLNITHGDIKTENILVLSWDWLVLTDFSSNIKPTYLPEDNPGEFSFYFDTSKRRTCYLATERFDTKLHEKTRGSSGKTTKEMDIFSLGCCIAEIYAEGRPLFNLSQLFKYKNNDYDVVSYLMEEIGNESLKNMIMDMINIIPKKRLSCRQLLEKYRGSFFPEYFYTFTYEYFRTLATMGTSVPITGSICANTILEDQVNVIDECCRKLYDDFGKICQELKYRLNLRQSDSSNESDNNENYVKNSIKLSNLGELELKSNDSNEQAVREECALLFISFLSHGLRSLTSSDTKLRCLELLVAFAQYVSDENKVDRVVPYLVASFDDEFPNVQATAIQALAQVLFMTENINPINENLFVDYLLPRIKKTLLQSKQNSYVRMVIANCLGNLVTVAIRFQEVAYLSSSLNPAEAVTKGMDSLEITSKHNRRLLQQVEALAVTLLIDSDTCVKMALLNNILVLCKFFGRERTNDVVLSHLITYLNDKDPSLRIKLVQTIAGIAVLLGPITLEQYILPLLTQTINDSEELVVVSVLQSLKNLCRTGLIQKKFFYDICTSVNSLILHPNVWIRQFSMLLIVEISNNLSKAEVYCVLYPIVRPFFEFDVEFTHDLMLSSCKQPVSRTVYNLLCSWSLRASKSLFWQQVPSNHVDAFGNSNIALITKNYSKKNYGFGGLSASKAVVLSPNNEEIPLTIEDKNWIDKFKSVGLAEGDLWKLAALRGYILRTAKLISRKNEIMMSEENDNAKSYGQSTISLPNVMPKNVFFDIDFSNEPDKNQIMNTDSVRTSSKGKLQGHLNSLPSVKDMNGSLLFTTKAAATTTPNLENIYVHLDFSTQHKNTPTKVSMDNNDGAKFTVNNSYEGDVSTIKTFLHQIKILPPMREYKEFGPTISDTQHTKITHSPRGTLVTALNENYPVAVTGMAVSSGPVPYMVTGSVQGQLKLWNIAEIASGEIHSSSLNYDLSSTITSITMLDGYDAFCVSTKDGRISVLRSLYQFDDNQLVFTALQPVRKIRIKQSSKRETFATCLKSVVTENTSILVALTNTSDVIIYDIRTMDLLQKIESPPSHGAVTSFCVSEKGSVLIIGTTKGVIDVWDLRFHVLISTWTFGDHTPISHLEECEALGKNVIAVVGGFSGATLSIWNYCKIRCQQALINSDEQPSIENFIPHKKLQDQQKFGEVSTSETIRSIYITGEKVFLSSEETNDLFMLNVKNLASSSVLIGPNSRSSSVVPIQVTANLTYLLLRRGPSSLGSNDTEHCNDSVNCMASINVDNAALLITSDNSGTIGVFS